MTVGATLTTPGLETNRPSGPIDDSSDLLEMSGVRDGLVAHGWDAGADHLQIGRGLALGHRPPLVLLVAVSRLADAIVYC
jgi:hypothetical protein